MKHDARSSTIILITELLKTQKAKKTSTDNNNEYS